MKLLPLKLFLAGFSLTALMRSRVALAAWLGLYGASAFAAEIGSLTYDATVPQLAFAAGEIRQAMQTTKTAPEALTLTLEITTPQLGSQAYRIERATNGLIRVIGGDATGAMYGGLDVAEAIRLGSLSQLTSGEHRPHIARRGIKFNIPLDLRTPSYSDNSTSAQANIPEMWSLDFWRALLDQMARDRFNVLTLWNLHPFPSIVKVPEYPDVALNDVWRTTADLVKPFPTFSTLGTSMLQPWMLDKPEIVKRLTIDQKIQFWREVMQYANDRGVEVYWFTWNIFTFGTEGKYGITSSQTNATTRDYFRKSVRETVLTYPRLAGIGITAGENMQEHSGVKGKEEWLWATYGEGVRDALKTQPGRNFRLIHRLHMTGLAPILDQWREFPGQFEFSYKYAIAHMYASTAPKFIQDVLPEINSEHRTWLTVRNDDLYSFRWGDPDFARDFINHMPGPDKLAGYYMGPDGYCWGRDFLSRDAVDKDGRRQLVMDRQWFSFNLWGRLSFEPTLPNEHFQRVLGARHPSVSAAKLLAASQASSRIIPQVTRFNWGAIDVHWYPEANLSHPRQYKGFYTVRHFMEGVTMPGENVLSITAWRNQIKQGKAITAQTPPQVADALESDADRTLKLVTELRALAAATDRELALTLGDFEAQAWLGRYYAAKIRGACALAEFNDNSDPAQQALAVKHLEAALEHWRQYATAYDRQYAPHLLNRAGPIDIPGFTKNVANDIEIVRAWKPGTPPLDPKAKKK